MNAVHDAVATAEIPPLARFASLDALALGVADAVAAAVRNGIAQRGAASLVVSGGSTPAHYFPYLARLDLEWERVTITLADERWVDASSEESNERTVRDLLLRGRAAGATFVPLRGTEATPRECAARANALFTKRKHAHDLVLLGMGADAHFASLFPRSTGLLDALDPESSVRCIAVPAPTSASPHVPRISMTLSELGDSLRVAIVIQGEAKLHVLQAAFENGDCGTYPIRALGNAVLRGRTSIFYCP